MARNAQDQTEKQDPTVSTNAANQAAASTGNSGAHPVRPVSEAADFAGDKSYSDAPDDVKPDKSSIVQVEDNTGSDAPSPDDK